MTKTPRTVKDSFKTASVSRAKALSAAKRVRDGRAASTSVPSTLYKSAPVLVKKAA